MSVALYASRIIREPQILSTYMLSPYMFLDVRSCVLCIYAFVFLCSDWETRKGFIFETATLIDYTTSKL
jgi:hypothetical protein